MRLQQARWLRQDCLRTLGLIVCLLAILMTACGGTSQSGSAQKATDDKQVFVYPISGKDISTFDPATAEDNASVVASGMVFTGLVQVDENQKLIKQLAESYSVANDGLTWTFKLRPNLKFSDGSSLTAQDVLYSINRALDPKTKSTTAPIYLNLIKGGSDFNAGKIPTLINVGLFAPDPSTVKIVTEKRAVYFLYTLAYISSFVVNKKVIDKYGDQWTDHLSEGAGAGPFINSKYIKGRGLEFTPNPNYYGSKVQLKKVVMPFYQSNDTVYRAYQAGQVSWGNVSSANVESARQLPDKQYHAVPAQSIYYLTMNYYSKPFNNIKVRQALALALNKEQIAHSIYKDNVIPTNHIVPSGIPSYNPNLAGPAGVTSLKGDRTKAKQLFNEGLQEEGLSVKNFPTISLYYNAAWPVDDRNMLTAAQQTWQEVLGISIKLEGMDYPSLLKRNDETHGNPNGMQMWFIRWGSDYPDPQNWLTLLFDKNSSYNSENFGLNTQVKSASRQQQAIDLMQQADGNIDNAERIKQYQQAEQILVDEVAWLPIYQAYNPTVVKPCVEGLSPTAQGLPAGDNWAKLYISTQTPCTLNSSL